MTTQFDSMPVSVIGPIGGQISLLDVLKASYGNEVNTISSVKIAYRDHDFFTNTVDSSGAVVARPTNQIFNYWDPFTPHDTTVSLNGKDIGGSGANSFNLTTVSNADFANTIIHSGNNIMPNLYVQVTWASANGQTVSQQELNFNSIPTYLDSPALQAARTAHAGAPTAADVVLAAEHVASVEKGVVNANDCHFIAQDIAALANAPLDPKTQNVTDPSQNQSGGFWRVQDFGSASHPLTNWQSEVQAGDIVRMGWSSGGFHTATVTAGLNSDGKHPGMIEVVDNAATGGKIDEHWVDYQSITDPKSITIYRLGSDHMNLIDGSADNHADTIIGTRGKDLIKGGDGGVTLNGGLGDDVLVGGAGNDVLDGWTGANTMYGGAGNDIYHVSSAQDVISETSYHGRGDAGGIDEVRTTLASYALPEANRANGNIENLSFSGYGSNFTGVGNALDNVITGGYGNDHLFGGSGNDVLYGGAGNDILNGGVGADEMAGGAGNDIYYVDNVNDEVIEANHRRSDAGGIDEIRTTLTTYALPEAIRINGNIENLTYIGHGNFNGTGNALDNVITGAGGNDTLTGGAGNDKLDGGTGINTAVFSGNASDYKITVYGDTAAITDLRAGSPDGTDTFKNIEFLKFADGLKHFNSSDYPIVGTSGRDVIDERPGNDSIDGGAGSDALVMTGKESDYKITVNGDIATITDLRAGSPDGTDTFKNIEFLRFSDGLKHFSPSNYVAGSVSIDNVVVTEGDNGSKLETFTVTRTGGNAAFDVHYTTADGSATTVDHDYVATSGTLHFDAGVTTRTISVTINGDTKYEGNESFEVDLSNATNGAVISHFAGSGTIIDDDPEPAGSHGPTAHDFNGDGNADIMALNSKSGNVLVWELDGNHIVKADTSAFPIDLVHWHADGIGDFNGDGKADMLWRNDDGRMAVWHTDDHVITAITGREPSSAWHVDAVADFNGDGKSDILVQNSDGQVGVWQMNGDHVTSAATIGTMSSDWHAVAAADFNGDGKADVLWQNADGRVAMWQMDGKDHISATTELGKVGSDWHVAGAADFGGDGRADILWQHDKGQTTMWQMDGGHVAANTTITQATGWTVVGTQDVNHDGKADILLENATGHVAEWQMNGDHIAQNLTVGTLSTDWHMVY
jgi:Ca2+-binding RTX toxin-like protein